MSQEPRALDTLPGKTEEVGQSEAEIAEAKRLEKMQAHSHSHHCAGTEHAPETAEEREQNASLSE